MDKIHYFITTAFHWYKLKHDASWINILLIFFGKCARNSVELRFRDARPESDMKLIINVIWKWGLITKIPKICIKITKFQFYLLLSSGWLIQFAWTNYRTSMTFSNSALCSLNNFVKYSSPTNQHLLLTIIKDTNFRR